MAGCSCMPWVHFFNCVVFVWYQVSGLSISDVFVELRWFKGAFKRSTCRIIHGWIIGRWYLTPSLSKCQSHLLCIFICICVDIKNTTMEFQERTHTNLDSAGKGGRKLAYLGKRTTKDRGFGINTGDASAVRVRAFNQPRGWNALRKAYDRFSRFDPTKQLVVATVDVWKIF